MQADEQAEMMQLLQSADQATIDKRHNADLRSKIYEQTRLIAELRHDEVNRQQTSRASIYRKQTEAIERVAVCAGSAAPLRQPACDTGSHRVTCHPAEAASLVPASARFIHELRMKGSVNLSRRRSINQSINLFCHTVSSNINTKYI